MPKTTFQRVVFTVIGVILMATTMATYNKYLVMKEFSPELFRQVAIAFCQKAPFAFILQFFFVQKWVGKKVAQYKVSNQIEYTCLRVGHTVMIMAPLMCAYSNIINMIQFHWSFGQFLAAVVSKTPVNWIFAFCVQVWLLTPLNKKIFGIIFKKHLAEVSV